jgi:Mn-dependent DtxR family transcriptional regulator
MIDSHGLQNRAVIGPELTDRQRDIITTIDRYYAVTGEPCPATYIGRRLRLHHSTVQDHLERLHRKGWLRAPNAPAVPARSTG